MNKISRCIGAGAGATSSNNSTKATGGTLGARPSTQAAATNNGTLALKHQRPELGWLKVLDGVDVGEVGGPVVGVRALFTVLMSKHYEQQHVHAVKLLAPNENAAATGHNGRDVHKHGRHTLLVALVSSDKNHAIAEQG